MARKALTLVTATACQMPSRSASTVSTRSNGASMTSQPRARSFAAVRSPSGSGRVTRIRIV